MVTEPPERHFGFVCRKCGAVDFLGRRYACWSCIDYHVCGQCYDSGDLPTSETHMYYHPLETHYTRAEYILYFGRERYVESEVPQSFKCAFCNMVGLTCSQLYHHVAEEHREHADFVEYFAMLHNRYSAETHPPIEANTAAAAESPSTGSNEPKETAALEPGRFILEIIRPEPRHVPSNNSRQRSYAAHSQIDPYIFEVPTDSDIRIVDRPIDLGDATNLRTRAAMIHTMLSSAYPQPGAFSAVERRAANRSGQSTVNSASGPEAYRHINQSNVRGQHQRRRRHGLVPGSSAAAAASAVAASTSNIRNAAYNAAIQMVRQDMQDQGSLRSARRSSNLVVLQNHPLSPVDQPMTDHVVRRTPTTTLSSTLSEYSQERHVNGWDDSYLQDSRPYSGLNPFFTPGQDWTAANLSTQAAIEALRMRLHAARNSPTNVPPQRLSERAELRKRQQTQFQDIVHEMVYTRKYRSVLFEIMQKVELRRAANLAKQTNQSNQAKKQVPKEDGFTGKFLCQKFIKSIKPVDMLQATLKKKQQAEFAEALICSMLSKEQLSSVECTIDWNAPQEATVSKDDAPNLKNTVKENNGGLAEAPLNINEKFGVAIMKRFYKGLDFYKNWLNNSSSKKSDNGKMPVGIGVFENICGLSLETTAIQGDNSSAYMDSDDDDTDTDKELEYNDEDFIDSEQTDVQRSHYNILMDAEEEEEDQDMLISESNDNSKRDGNDDENAEEEEISQEETGSETSESTIGMLDEVMFND